MSIELARAVADAVLYEGYLLYPYRATSSKNQVRWQFGVLGPEGAEENGTGEGSGLSMQTLVRDTRPEPVERPPDPAPVELVVHVRFLQVQQRRTEQFVDGEFVDGSELRVDDQRWFSWDEAVEVEREQRISREQLLAGSAWAVRAEAGEDTEEIRDHTGAIAGRLVRRRWGVRAAAYAQLEPSVSSTGADGLYRLTVSVTNQTAARGMRSDDALRCSLVGTHVIVEAAGTQTRFLSVIDPPEDAVAAAASCAQHRCWPVLAGPEGAADLVLGSPIILYDHPEIAPQSPGALFDGCEIDEILTLRVMTMTDNEKAEARATDPRAREIIERCENLTPEELQQLHGILRDPYADAGLVPADAKPWWDPAEDERVHPDVDAVLIDGISVSRGSLVRVHPSRRADAQDLFFADQVARVTAVLSDVDGGVHVALVLVDDPAADLHDWYGRYLYFAPDELEPLLAGAAVDRTGEQLATGSEKES